MRPTTPGIILLFLVLATLAAPMAALGQTQGPSALWDAYPLDQTSTTPAPATAAPPAAETPVPEAPPATAPEPSGDDGIPIWAIIAGALAVVVVGGGVAIFTLARLRDRRQTETVTPVAPAPAPAAEPEPEPEPVPVAAAVAAAEAASARAPEPAPPDPLPAPPEPPVTAAPPAPLPEPAPVPPTVAPGDDDLELAELAAEYLWTVATGSRRPVVDLAARRSLRVGRAREMLSRARSRGILAGAGRGRPGGALTEKGRRLLEAGSRATEAPAWKDEAPAPGVATSETAATPPPLLRLANGDEEGTGSIPAQGAASEEGEDAGRAFTVLEGGARNLP